MSSSYHAGQQNFQTMCSNKYAYLTSMSAVAYKAWYKAWQYFRSRMENRQLGTKHLYTSLENLKQLQNRRT